MGNKKIGRPGDPHGSRNHPLYKTWTMMRQRCKNPKATSYCFYGGRGIKVCPLWDTNFWAFVAHMGPKPDATYTLDRINPDGNYEPGNCRWASPELQVANRRKANHQSSNRRYVVNGVQRHLTDLCEEYGIKAATVRARMKLKGMTLIEALATPARVYKRQS